MGGRPPIHIDEKQLRQCALIHCTKEETADLLGISMTTLNSKLRQKKYGTIWREGRASGKMSLRRAMFRSALGEPERIEDRELPDGSKLRTIHKGIPPNVQAQIWLSKQSPERGGLGMRDSDPGDGGVTGDLTLFDLLVASADTPKPEIEDQRAEAIDGEVVEDPAPTTATG